MKNTEFRNSKLADGLAKAIAKIAPLDKLTFMDVCGTHTVNIFKFGIKNLLPSTINLISGPGCPVCVTSQEDIDFAIEICKIPDLILLTFGDMLKVPGTYSSLEKEIAKGRDVRIVYSPLDAIQICKKNLSKKIVFFAIGFETTSPTIAATLIQARREKIKNFFIYPSHKLILPAMRAILNSKDININGFICPGHVSTIIGSKAYEPIVHKYNIPCVITGFEPLDILQGIYLLVKQSVFIKNSKGNANVEVQYKRCVTEDGNIIAKSILSEVFKVADAKWRGLGIIPNSGLALRKKYSNFDIRNYCGAIGQLISGRVYSASSGRPWSACSSSKLDHYSNGRPWYASSGRVYSALARKYRQMQTCRCGEVLRGVITPEECPLFSKVCTPENPCGPCMVSSEGTCAAHYKYR